MSPLGATSAQRCGLNSCGHTVADAATLQGLRCQVLGGVRFVWDEARRTYPLSSVECLTRENVLLRTSHKADIDLAVTSDDRS